MKHTSPRGSAFLLTLFFSSLFLMMFGATLSFIMVQHTAVNKEVSRARALHIAEAGVNYYRWHLAHAPDDFSTDTGLHQYMDPHGGVFGEFVLSVTPPPTTSTVAILTADAHVADDSSISRVRVRYGQPSLAHYAFLTNSNVWFGDTEEISGLLHSNGGVRMDGQGDSLLTSAQETYICGPEHGCANEEKDGVWGTGEDPAFWQYPVEALDFGSLIVDLDDLQDLANTPDGLYLGDSGAYGYYIVFNADGTMTVNTVTAVFSPVYGYNGSEWTYESNDKSAWSPVVGYQNIPIPNNGIIFAEDDVWVGGSLNGRAMVAAARLPDGYYPRADIYLQDNITYTAHDGTSALGLIAQQDILSVLRVPQKQEIDAALMAVNGHVFRYYYPAWSSEPYATYAIRDMIETFGTIITNTVWTWSWVSSESGPVVSGFEETETTYDPDLTYGPPPAFPTVDEYTFISWEQLELDE